MNRGKTFFAWHTLALAYAYFKKGDEDEFRKWLEKSKTKPEYHDNVDWFQELYPEIKDFL
jgi:hypothetical protein